MSIGPIPIFLEDDDDVVAEFMESGTLAIDLGSGAILYVQASSRHYDRFVSMFIDSFVHNETAPGDQTGDGTKPEMSHNPIVGDHRE